MGTNISKQVIDSTTSITQKVLNEFVNTAETEAIARAYSNQEAVIDATGARLYKCPVTIEQDAKVTAASFGDTSNQLSNNLANELKAQIKEKLEQTLQQANKDLNLFQTNFSDVRTKSSTYIDTELTNIIKNGIKNTVVSEGVSGQKATIILRGADCVESPATITQKALIDIMARNISKSIVENTIKNSISAEVDKEIKQKVEQTNAGLNIAIVAIIILLVIVGGAGFILKSPVGKIIMIVLVVAGIGALAYFIYKRTRPDSEKIPKLKE